MQGMAIAQSRLTAQGQISVPAAVRRKLVVRKITGHRSRELERYQHLSPTFRAQTVDLIAQVLFATDTPTDTPAPDAEDAGDDGPETLFPEGRVGGVDGTRVLPAA